MKILMLAPYHTSATDGVIIQGIHNILKHIYQDYQTTYITFKTNELLPDSAFYSKEEFDLLLIAGTPWIWDLFHLSVKWKNLERCFQIHNKVPKIFMGIGSCLFSEYEFNESICERPEEQDALRRIYSQATVIVRDSIAYNKLKKVGIDCQLLVCPSFFCYGLLPVVPKKNEQNVLVWYDPTIGLSQSGWSDPIKLNQFYNLNLEFYQKYQPKVYTHLEPEIKKAIEIGLPKPELINNWQETLNIMQSANYVLSGRVHCSVPAFVQGKPVGLIQIDSRSRVISDFGGTIITNINQFNNLGYQYRDFTIYLNEYIRIIKNIKI